MVNYFSTKNLLKSILAGILIGLSGFAFLSISNKIIGAILFSLGLMAVVLLEQKLYTGLIGYAKYSDLFDVLIVLVGNFLGSALMGVICHPLVQEQSADIITNKLNIAPFETFIKSIICGMLIYLAVELYKHKQDLLCLIIPVTIFVLTNTEHCIANMFYCFASSQFDIRMLYFIPICIVGNSIGSIIIRLLQKQNENQNEC